MCTLERALIGVPADRCAPSRWHLSPFLWPLAHPKLGELAELGGLGELGWRDPPPLGHLWVSLRNPFQLACAIPSGMFWSHFQALACKQQFQELILMRTSLLREANISRKPRYKPRHRLIPLLMQSCPVHIVDALAMYILPNFSWRVSMTSKNT